MTLPTPTEEQYQTFLAWWKHVERCDLCAEAEPYAPESGCDDLALAAALAAALTEDVLVACWKRGIEELPPPTDEDITAELLIEAEDIVAGRGPDGDDDITVDHIRDMVRLTGPATEPFWREQRRSVGEEGSEA